MSERHDNELRAAIMQSLRLAAEPIREAVLFERVSSRVTHAPSPKHFLDTAEHLAVEGYLTLMIDHEDTGQRDPEPFRACYYRLVRD